MGPFLERGISISANSRTGYKKLAHFQNWVSILAESFFRTGCQFGVPGGTYPPKKFSSASPRGFQQLRENLRLLTLSGSPVCGVWVILKQFQGVRTVLFRGNASWELQKTFDTEIPHFGKYFLGITAGRIIYYVS